MLCDVYTVYTNGIQLHIIKSYRVLHYYACTNKISLYPLIILTVHRQCMALPCLTYFLGNPQGTAGTVYMYGVATA